MTTLLIDADFLAVQAAYAVQKTWEWEVEDEETGETRITTSASGDVSEALSVFEDSLRKIEEVTGPGELILCWSCPSRRYFRHDLWPTYKGNRKSAPPVALEELKSRLVNTYQCKVKPGLEADDVLGIYATHEKFYRGRCIIVSPDKDLDQIIGYHVNPLKPERGVYRVEGFEAKFHLAYQALVGDSTDNYPGCPRIGDIRARKLLAEVPPGESYVPAIQAAYERAGKTVEEMAVQINVARILTASTYNFKSGEPILWQPPKA
jgi:DNA polymerase-1